MSAIATASVPALTGRLPEDVSRPQRWFDAVVKFARRHTLGAIGGAIVLLFVLTGLLAPGLAPYDPNAVSVRDALQPPSRAHPLGTDNNGRDLLSIADDELRNLRGDRITMIFQEPMTSLNPSLTIGDQIGEVLIRHRKV